MGIASETKQHNVNMAQDRKNGNSDKSMTAVEWFAKEINNMNVSREATLFINKLKEQAKQMEKEQNDKWNEFLDAEKVLGISDVKTIERIQWYYNTYFNKTFGKS